MTDDLELEELLGDPIVIGIRYSAKAAIENRMSERRRQINATPIESLGFSTRVYNALRGAYSTQDKPIRTLGDLLEQTDDTLLERKNFGVQSLYEVDETLMGYGLYLKGRKP